MTHKLKMFTGLLLICMACSKDKETPSGVKFTVLREGDGVKLDSGKFLVVNMVFKDGKDSVYNDTEKNGVPFVIPINTEVPKGDAVLEAIMMMTKGDSIVFKIAAKPLFEKTFRAPLPPNIDSASQFTFNVGLADVLNQEQIQKLQSEIMAKQKEKFEKQSDVQFATDVETIDKYLNEKGIAAVKSETGLRYIITKVGNGENAKSGQSASINYAGHLLNGKFFDSSIEAIARQNNIFMEGRPYEPYSVVVDESQVIQGWHDVIKLMNKGSKVTVYIPSTLAYGAQRKGQEIVENSILVFDMEMVDLK